MSDGLIAPPTRRFGWHDMNSAEADASAAFYTALFGWELQVELQPNGYRMLSNAGTGFGGMFPWPDELPEPSQWTGYLLVEDVVATARRAQALGGFVPFESMPILGAGTLGVVGDPTGATVTTFRPGEWTDAWTLGPGGSGSTVIWNELITTDQQRACAFYRDLVGWEFDQDVVDTGGHAIARVDGMAVAGVFATDPKPAASAWITYFGVTAIGEVVDRAKALGARVVHEVTDVPEIGFTAWVADPQQAVFGLMQPAEGWYERL